VDQAEALIIASCWRGIQFRRAAGQLIAAGIARKDQAAVKELSERLFTALPNSPAALEDCHDRLSKNDFQAAVKHCSKLVEVAPQSFEGWFNLGVAWQELGRLDQAGKAYTSRKDSSDSGPRMPLGAILQQQSDLTGAAQGARARLATVSRTSRRYLESRSGD